MKASVATRSSPASDSIPRPPRVSIWWLALFMALLMLPGCGGCSADVVDEDPEQVAAKAKEELKKKDKPKPDFDPVKLRIVPQKTDEKEAQLRWVKPGHWTAAVEEMKANNFDFVGQLYADTRANAAGQPLDLEHTPHRLAISRPAPLGKGQPKFFELQFIVPRNQTTRPWLFTELRSRGGGVAATPGAEPLQLMKAHQYHLVVLASEADRYRRLETLDSIRAPHHGGQEDLSLEGALNYYSVIAPPLAKPLPLPSNALAWTSIAYLIWDDADPNLLSLEQQQALVDWLHYGGQLIISGPKSLDQLRDKSFLGSYLPALPGEPLKISAETLAPLSNHWSQAPAGQPKRPLAPVNPWSGVTLLKQGDAQFLDNTADLVVERRVGRGRIVATAFRLTQRELWNWPSYDGFFNACLLRRPARHFSSDGGLSVDWADDRQRFRDPLRVTQLRYFSRDWNGDNGFSVPLPARQSQTEEEQLIRNRSFSRFNSAPLSEDESSLIGPGVAAWNDFSPMAGAARDSLREAAGIVIPKSEFVVWVLVLYLLVLVPLNWGIFWGLGRVEWAWVAAPVIAIGGMAAVVKLAQLDIGFARSQTEMAVLEMHNGYARGHLTRYTALYTSLSTTYDVNPQDRTTLVLPFPSDPNFEPRAAQAIDTVTYHCDPGVHLTDFAVSSNSTAMLHSEQMIDLGGAMAYVPSGSDGAELTNRTKHSLKRAALLRRTAGGNHQVGWIGELASGQSAKVTFLHPDSESNKAQLARWSFTLTTSAEEGSPKLSLDRMADLIRNGKSLLPGEVRLVGLIEEPLAGLDVDPAASQSGRGATLVVVTLQAPSLQEPKPDHNTRRDVISARDELDRPDDAEADEPLDPASE